MNPHRSKRYNLLAGVFGLMLVLVGLLGLWQREYIGDWLRVSLYTPPDSIAEISQSAKLSETGEFYFYASQPTLDGTQNFNDVCGQHEKSSNIIGCYTNQKIYLYDVNSKELSGIEEVTAAHEMLHAAYDRLSEDTRQHINRLLAKEANRRLADKAFRERMAAYADLAEPDKINEYHSIFGTEIRQISSELEDYYRKYFDDRSHIVRLYERYSGIFQNLVRESQALADELDQQALIINRRVFNYRQDSASLSAAITAFNGRAERGEFSSRQQFNAERQNLVNRTAGLENEYQEIQRLINQYNATKQRYEGLAEHLTSLNNSIDSSLAPAPAVN